MSKLKMAVAFHQRAVEEGKTKNGVAVCSTVPIPINEWGNSSNKMQNYKSYQQELEDEIMQVQDDFTGKAEELNDYDRGYDEGYIAGLTQALRLYCKED